MQGGWRDSLVSKGLGREGGGGGQLSAVEISTRKGVQASLVYVYGVFSPSMQV